MNTQIIGEVTPGRRGGRSVSGSGGGGSQGKGGTVDLSTPDRERVVKPQCTDDNDNDNNNDNDNDDDDNGKKGIGKKAKEKRRGERAGVSSPSGLPSTTTPSKKVRVDYSQRTINFPIRTSSVNGLTADTPTFSGNPLSLSLSESMPSTIPSQDPQAISPPSSLSLSLSGMKSAGREILSGIESDEIQCNCHHQQDNNNNNNNNNNNIENVGSGQGSFLFAQTQEGVNMDIISLDGDDNDDGNTKTNKTTQQGGNLFTQSMLSGTFLDTPYRGNREELALDSIDALRSSISHKGKYCSHPSDFLQKSIFISCMNGCAVSVIQYNTQLVLLQTEAIL